MHSSDASRPTGRLFLFAAKVAAIALLLTATAHAADITKTIVHDTIYRADGAPASGTLLISWPSFRTANDDLVAAGSTTVAIGSGGFFSVALAPTEGANPASVQYRVVLQPVSGPPEVQYWIVPAVGESGIVFAHSSSSSTPAGNYLTKQYVDDAIHAITGQGLTLQQQYADLPTTGGKITLASDTVLTASFVIDKPNVELACAAGVSITGSFNAPLITATGVDRFKLHGCTLSNTFTSSTTTSAYSNIVNLSGVTNSELYDNKFTAGVIGAYFRGGSNDTVRDNTFTGISVVAIDAGWDGSKPADRLTILRNKISGTSDYPSWANYSGSGHDVNLEDTTNFRVEANEIDGSTGTLGTDSREIIASCIQVGPNHFVGTIAASGVIADNHCYDPAHHRKAGINFAGSGTVGNVVVTARDLTIHGNTVDGPQYCYHSTTLHDGNTQGVVIADGFGYNCQLAGILLQANSGLTTITKQDIEVSNMHLEGAGPATIANGIELRQVSGVKAHGGSVSNFGVIGVYLRGASHNSVNNVRVFNNGQNITSAYGITLSSIIGITSDRNDITGNQLSDTQSTPTQTHGIYVDSGDANRVYNNTCVMNCVAPWAYGGTNIQRGGNSWGDPQTALTVDGANPAAYSSIIYNRDPTNGSGGLYLQTGTDGSGNSRLVNLYQGATQRFAIYDNGQLVWNGPSFLPPVPGSQVGSSSLPVDANIGAAANRSFHFNTTNLSANRIYAAPDKNGTLATTDDIPSVPSHVAYRLCGTTADVVITGTHTEQTILTCTLPALAQGSKIKVRAVAAANATNATATIAYKLGGTTGTSHSSTATGNTTLIEEIDITNTASAASQLWSGSYSLGGTYNPDYNATTINTALATTITITYTPSLDADSRTFKQADVILYQ